MILSTTPGVGMPGDRFIQLALDEGRHVLDVLFKHAGEAVTVQDRTGLIFANDRAANMVGLRSGKEMVARPVVDIVASYEMLDSSGAPLPDERLPGRRVLDGEPAAEELIGYRRRGTDEVAWSLVRASPIKNDDGEVVWAVNFFLDVTDQVRREEDERLLTRARETLGTSLELDGIIRSLVELMLPGICSSMAVHLVDDAGVLALAGLGCMDLASVPRAHVADSQSPVDPDRLQARVLTGPPGIAKGIAEDLMVDFEAWPGPGNGPSAMGSVVCLPLGSGDRALGTLTVGRAPQEGSFGPRDLALLKSLSDRAAVAFSNSLLFAYERKAAEALQQGLMPSRPPDMFGWQVAVRYLPQARISGVGGDFYDVISVGNDTFAVVVGDVEGKGIPAAATVGLVRHTVQVTTNIDADPAVVFRHVNAVLREQRPSRMCTLAYLTFHGGSVSTRVMVALAGHPPPLVISRDGGLAVVGEPSPPAGVLEEIIPRVQEHKMESGDTMVLCTDGFEIGDVIPPDSLYPLLRGAHEEDLDRLVDRLMQQLRDEPDAQRDDVIILALRMD